MSSPIVHIEAVEYHTHNHIDIGALTAELKNINHHLKSIEMTNQEAIDKINAQSTQLGKIKTEVQKLVDAAQNQGNISPELESAINGLQTAIQGVDDLNADEATAPPEEQPPV